MSQIAEPQSESAALQELIAKLDPDSRTFFAEAALGRDAQEFIGTDLGRYLVGCAQQEYAEAMVKLKTVSWWNVWKVTELQNKAWRAESFLVWLRDLVIKGKAAELALQEGEEE